MSKNTKKHETVEEMAKRLNKPVEEVKAALKFKETLANKEAAAIAKYGKGSGRKNRQTGEVEEIDIVKGSCRYRPNASGQGGKFTVVIKCVDTGDEREVATSDLFQIARSEEAQKDYLSRLRKEKRAAAKAKKVEIDPELLKEIG